MFILVFGLAVLVACWWVGDLLLSTKIFFTLLYAATFGFFFIKNAAYLFIVAQCVFVAVVGTAMFGIEWLTRKR
jgi:hypothetical protein